MNDTFDICVFFPLARALWSIHLLLRGIDFMVGARASARPRLIRRSFALVSYLRSISVHSLLAVAFVIATPTARTFSANYNMRYFFRLIEVLLRTLNARLAFR